MMPSGLTMPRKFAIVIRTKGYEKEEYTAAADREGVTERSGLQDPADR